MEKEEKTFERYIKKQRIAHIVLAAVVIICVMPWFKSGIAATDDFRHHAAKFWWMKYSFHTYGHFVEWMPFIYSGWPMTHFYHSLPYYASLPFILTMDTFAALKASVITSFILAALAMFFAGFKLTGNKEIASLASVFYIFAPIHFEFAYRAGSLSRLWAYVFLPLAIAYFIMVLDETNAKNMLLAAVSIAALTYTNINLTIAFSYTLGAYAVYYFVGRKKIETSKIKSLLLCAVLVIGLLSFWVLPYLAENQDSSTTSLSEHVFGSNPPAEMFSQVFSRAYIRNIDGEAAHYSFYIGYVLLTLSLIGMYALRFKHKRAFSTLGIAGIILTVFTAPLKLLPFGGAIILSHYFLLHALFFISIIAATLVHTLSTMRQGTLLMLVILALFGIDIRPAYTARYWLTNPTEAYTNSPEVLAAYSFIHDQPGLFRTYSPIGELPFMYTDKSEIGIEWTGYREGAFKPIRKLTDNLSTAMQANATAQDTYLTLGYLGTKFITLQCMQDLGKILPVVYSNKAVCVYEDPAFQSLVTSPAKVQLVTQPRDSADAYILEQCFSNCTIERKQAAISGIRFDPEIIAFTAKADTPAFVLVKSAYFKPHWRAYVDGAETNIRKAWPYYMLIEIPPGTNAVEFRYESNATHWIADAISIVSLLAVACWLLPESVRRKTRMKSSESKKNDDEARRKKGIRNKHSETID